MKHLWRSAVIAALGTGVAAAWDASYHLLGEQAPDFALRALQGDNMRLSEHRGEVVILTFWGSRCSPCGEQLAALDRSYKTYQSAGLKVFGINVDDDQARARESARARSVGFPMLLDPDKSVSRQYRIDNLPMTILIDRSGAVRHVHRDYSAKGEEFSLRQLRALLNE